MYETFEHTADLGLRVRAGDPESLLVDAARGLFSIIAANLDEIRPLERVEIEVRGELSAWLLFDWLNELLYLYETRRLLLATFEVHLDDAGLQATAFGEAIDHARHQLDHEVKAITYHGLKLEREGESWLAEVIVDI